MEIEVKTLMNDNEMLSHIFLGCMSREELLHIKEKYIGADDTAKDWQKESVTIPVEMTIGGIPVNPKEFFDEWQKQMGRMISVKATILLSEEMGSRRMRELSQRFSDIGNILESFEKEVTWDVENPFQEPKSVQDGCSKL